MRLSFVHIFFSIALRALLLALVSSIRTLLGLTPRAEAISASLMFRTYLSSSSCRVRESSCGQIRQSTSASSKSKICRSGFSASREAMSITPFPTGKGALR